MPLKILKMLSSPSLSLKTSLKCPQISRQTLPGCFAIDLTNILIVRYGINEMHFKPCHPIMSILRFAHARDPEEV